MHAYLSPSAKLQQPHFMLVRDINQLVITRQMLFHSLQLGYRQWGILNKAIPSGVANIAFPIVYEHKALYATCTVIHNNFPDHANCVYNVKNDGMIVGSASTTEGFYWASIGY